MFVEGQPLRFLTISTTASLDLLFTVGMIQRGFKVLTNVQSSEKLECSLYGAEWMVMAPRRDEVVETPALFCPDAGDVLFFCTFEGVSWVVWAEDPVEDEEAVLVLFCIPRHPLFSYVHPVGLIAMTRVHLCLLSSRNASSFLMEMSKMGTMCMRAVASSVVANSSRIGSISKHLRIFNFEALQ